MEKRLIVSIVLAVILLFVSNAIWLWAWMQFDYGTETVTDTYSVDMDGGMYDGNSYARGRGRNARRDSMGRYSRDGSYRGGPYRYDGYSRDGKEEYIENLRNMMDDAPDDQTRQSIQRMIQQMEQG